MQLVITQASPSLQKLIPNRIGLEYLYTQFCFSSSHLAITGVAFPRAQILPCSSSVCVVCGSICVSALFSPHLALIYIYLLLPKDIGPPTLLEIFRRSVGRPVCSTQPWRHAHTHKHPPPPTHPPLSHASHSLSLSRVQLSAAASTRISRRCNPIYNACVCLCHGDLSRR